MSKIILFCSVLLRRYGSTNCLQMAEKWSKNPFFNALTSLDLSKTETSHGNLLKKLEKQALKSQTNYTGIFDPTGSG